MNQTKGPTPRGKLLIVDDEYGVRESMRLIFEREYDLFVADNGRTAIEIGQKNEIDVALLDIEMGGGVSGLDVLERLRFLKPDIEAIMITGFETTDTRRQALRLGACDYITKPYGFATIRAAVSKAMQRRTLESERTAAREKSSSKTRSKGAS